MIGTAEIHTRFECPDPNSDQLSRQETLRTWCAAMANHIDNLCPDSREKSDALTNLDYVLFQAIAAIDRREPKS
jgi:hypothetical protein